LAISPITGKHEIEAEEYYEFSQEATLLCITMSW